MHLCGCLGGFFKPTVIGTPGTGSPSRRIDLFPYIAPPFCPKSRCYPAKARTQGHFLRVSRLLFGSIRRIPASVNRATSIREPLAMHAISFIQDLAVIMLIAGV